MKDANPEEGGFMEDTVGFTDAGTVVNIIHKFSDYLGWAPGRYCSWAAQYGDDVVDLLARQAPESK